MDKLLDFWAHEPAVITQVVTQVLALVVAFGVPVTSDQRGAVVALVEVLGAAISAWVIRKNVTPTGAPTLPSGTSVNVTTPVGQADYQKVV